MNTGLIIAVLTLIAMALIAVDFYLPGFVLGTIGAILMLIAVGLGYREYGIAGAVAVFIMNAALGIGAGYLSIRYGAQTAMGKKMILTQDQHNMQSHAGHSPALVGKTGIAESLLRPSGLAMLDGKRLDVEAESGMIERGSPVKVIAIEGTRIIVRKV